METHFRILIFFFVGIMPLVSSAQKKDWTFSDRTGIKGIQFSLGSYRISNIDQWQNVLRDHVEEPLAADSVHLIGQHWRANRAILQLELVYAPFRFNSNSWLRNTEILAGFSHRGYDEIMQCNWGGEINETDGQYFERSYSLTFNHTAAQVRVAVNRTILPSVMAYGTFGMGMGISRGLTIQSSNTKESYYSMDTVYQTFTHTNFVHQTEEVHYQSKGIRQQSLSLGVKVYLSCRMNIYAEYGMEFLQMHQPGTGNLYQNSQGFQLGLRFKFNPPEQLEEQDKLKDDNVFW
jgi:hypothetical protein